VNDSLWLSICVRSERHVDGFVLKVQIGPPRGRFAVVRGQVAEFINDNHLITPNFFSPDWNASLFFALISDNDEVSEGVHVLLDLQRLVHVEVVAN